MALEEYQDRHASSAKMESVAPLSAARKTSEKTSSPSSSAPLLLTRSGKPRKKCVRACVRCRSRKQRCNGAQPQCARCVVRGWECVYEDLPQVSVRRTKKQRTASSQTDADPSSPTSRARCSLSPLSAKKQKTKKQKQQTTKQSTAAALSAATSHSSSSSHALREHALRLVGPGTAILYPELVKSTSDLLHRAHRQATSSARSPASASADGSSNSATTRTAAAAVAAIEQRCRLSPESAADEATIANLITAVGLSFLNRGNRMYTGTRGAPPSPSLQYAERVLEEAASCLDQTPPSLQTACAYFRLASYYRGHRGVLSSRYAQRGLLQVERMLQTPGCLDGVPLDPLFGLLPVTDISRTQYLQALALLLHIQVMGSLLDAEHSMPTTAMSLQRARWHPERFGDIAGWTPAVCVLVVLEGCVEMRRKLKGAFQRLRSLRGAQYCELQYLSLAMSEQEGNQLLEVLRLIKEGCKRLAACDKVSRELRYCSEMFGAVVDGAVAMIAVATPSGEHIALSHAESCLAVLLSVESECSHFYPAVECAFGAASVCARFGRAELAQRGFELLNKLSAVFDECGPTCDHLQAVLRDAAKPGSHTTPAWNDLIVTASGASSPIDLMMNRGSATMLPSLSAAYSPASSAFTLVGSSSSSSSSSASASSSFSNTFPAICSLPSASFPASTLSSYSTTPTIASATANTSSSSTSSSPSTSSATFSSVSSPTSSTNSAQSGSGSGSGSRRKMSLSSSTSSSQSCAQDDTFSAEHVQQPPRGYGDRDSFSVLAAVARNSLDCDASRSSFSSLLESSRRDSFASLVASGRDSLAALASSSGMGNLNQFLSPHQDSMWLADFSDESH